MGKNWKLNNRLCCQNSRRERNRIAFIFFSINNPSARIKNDTFWKHFSFLTVLAIFGIVFGFSACKNKRSGLETEKFTGETENIFITENVQEDDDDIDVLFELKNPRMNGQDILNLQNRLLSLGFSEIGSADGYYGPLAEGVIKNIQTFSGFRANGKVNKKLWGFLFSNINTEFLQNMSNVLTHNPDKLTKSWDLYGDDPGDESAHVYYSPIDHKVKIVKHSIGNVFTDVHLTYYFVDDARYVVSDVYYFVNRIRTRWDFDSNVNVIDEEEMYLVNHERIFIIKNGILEPSDYQVIIELQMTILDRFFKIWM
ncbi:MAG: peptidoglycan-binding protein [Treponema sp.]|jgi:hypothetical protein|nr:peptidoglycan-binding protein [Treponema sp.]